MPQPINIRTEFSSHSRREQRIMFECEQGECPKCGAARGFSVPDWCIYERCPEPADIEDMLAEEEALRPEEDGK